MMPAWVATAQDLSLPAIALVVVVTGVVAFIRVLPQLRRVKVESDRVKMEGDASLRGDLLARIEAIEESNRKDREACEARMTRAEERHDRAIADLRAEMEEKVSTLRHDRNGLRQVLEFILTGIRKIDHPELAAVAIEAEKKLARHDELMALEKGAIAGSKRRRT